MTDHLTGSATMALQSTAGKGGTCVHLVPSGTFTGRDGRGPYVLANAQAVLQESQRYMGKHKMPIDYDHQIDNAEKNGQLAPAAGWITSLEARKDGIWGEVEWTAKAEALIAGGEYRYLSPVFTHAKDGTIYRVLRAALTNNPNLSELKALFSANTDSTNMEQFLAALRQLLNLPGDADNAAILEALGNVSTGNKSPGNPDPAKFVPIADFEKVVSELNSLKQGVSKQAAQEHVETQVRSANMPPYLRDWGVALCSVNKPAFDAFIHRTKGMFNQLAAHSSASALPPGHRQANTLSDQERDVCRRMGITAEEFSKSKSFIDSAKD